MGRWVGGAGSRPGRSWRLHCVCRAQRHTDGSTRSTVATSGDGELRLAPEHFLWHVPRLGKPPPLGAAGSLFLDVWGAGMGP